MSDLEEYAKLYDDPDMYDQWDIGPDHERTRFMMENVKGPKVLELGCGGSGFIRLLVDKGYRCTAVDVNPKWIRLGRQRLPQVNYVHSMIEDFETDEKFDTVMVMEVLEHVINPVSVLGRAFRYLRNGGRLLITVPKKGSPWDHTDNHLRQYTREMLNEDIMSGSLYMDDFDIDIREEGHYLYGVVTKHR